ncbi:ADP-ribosylglycohydrolase [Serratia fonticola]|uniref:ADP-ribosylglycohydrolase n=1 Tax=Serratia fonticola TaxID=47917 RepID=A0A4U9VCH9_SERFO|nr:ADP-ribosylglycohydrolase [Serratia fonticola]
MSVKRYRLPLACSPAAPPIRLMLLFPQLNIGNDTDTVATMVGAISGAFHGAAALPADYLSILDRMNHFSLEALAGSITQ